MSDGTPASEPTLYVIDGNWYIHRAFNALPHMSTRTGLPTNAIYGFALMLVKLMTEYRPTYCAVVFDSPRPSFRHELFDRYKVDRPPMQAELKEQIPFIHQLVEAFNLSRLVIDGVEADDIIATLARQAQSRGVPCTIVSGDKDLMQLVGDGTRLFDTFKEKIYNRAEVIEKWGVPPERMADLLALMGDSSDGIPGLSGCGEKTARSLLERFGDLEGLIARREEVSAKKVRASLFEPDAAEKLRLWKQLVSLRDQEPLAIDLDGLRWSGPDVGRLEPMLRELEMLKLVKSLTPSIHLDRESYRTITNDRDFAEVLAAIRAAGEMAFDLLTDRPDVMRAQVCGVAIAADGVPPCYVPTGHRLLGAPPQLPLSVVLGTLRPFLENPDIGKYVQNHKIEMILLGAGGIELRGVKCDPMIASYLLDPSRQVHGLEALAQERLGHTMMVYKDVCGTGAKQRGFDEIAVDLATRYAAEGADAILRLGRTLAAQVEADPDIDRLNRDIELPLARILAVMERHGVRLDTGHLARLGQETGQQIAALERQIHDLAGSPVNINSPKQLQELLFERLGLPVKKRLKTGPSTDADVLDELRDAHPVVGKILEYRELAKLKGTYIDNLPALVNPQTGRLHTCFNQTVAATGRLSSSDPNLQNIPVRSDLGRAIRRAFVADEGRVLVSADYSQIELRVLAHLSSDAVLIDAFERDQDVHRRTAAEVFNVPPDEVTHEQRSIAKTVNFGVIYGQSDFGLARQLGIERDVARQYIDSYFARYSGVREYMDRAIATARETRQSTTVLGRRRPIQDISSRNAQQRAYAERIARNTPIQGSAADLIKLAMIRMQRRIDENWPQVRMILTVHDELVFEVPADDAEFFARLARAEMEGVMELRVPLKVDVGIARNWTDAHP
ncbi:MAG TPA: DNA polymerase I [Polyangia bacterium]|jgi:DNA polymerase-1